MQKDPHFIFLMRIFYSLLKNANLMLVCLIYSISHTASHSQIEISSVDGVLLHPLKSVKVCGRVPRHGLPVVVYCISQANFCQDRLKSHGTQ